MTLAVVLGLAIGCALQDKPITLVPNDQYTYESKFDPRELTEWNIISAKQYLEDGYWHTLSVFENPDMDSPITKVIAIFFAADEWTLVSYGYTDGDVDYIYVLDIRRNHYKLWRETPHEYEGESV